MKGNRLLVILAILFVLLVTLLVVQNLQQSNSVPALPPNRVFTDLALNDIQAIRLRSPETNQSLVIARSGNGWTAPESSGALDQTEAENIAKTMVVLPFSRTIPLDASASKTEYGFTPEGIFSIEIALSSGDSHIVAVGYRTPTEDNYYGLVDNRPNLYLLNRAAVDFLISRLKSPPIA